MLQHNTAYIPRSFRLSPSPRDRAISRCVSSGEKLLYEEKKYFFPPPKNTCFFGNIFFRVKNSCWFSWKFKVKHCVNVRSRRAEPPLNQRLHNVQGTIRLQSEIIIIICHFCNVGLVSFNNSTSVPVCQRERVFRVTSARGYSGKVDSFRSYREARVCTAHKRHCAKYRQISLFMRGVLPRYLSARVSKVRESITVKGPAS